MTMKQMMLVFWRPGRRDLVRSTHTTIKRGWGGDRVARINGERVVEPRRRPLMARASSVPGETRGRGSFDYVGPRELIPCGSALQWKIHNNQTGRGATATS